MEKKFERALTELELTEGVFWGVVVSKKDGSIEGSVNKVDPIMGEVVAFIGSAAEVVANALNCNKTDGVLVVSGDSGIIVLEEGDYCLGAKVIDDHLAWKLLTESDLLTSK